MIGHRHGDRHVNAHHADIYTGGKFARGMAIAREDSNAIAILMCRGQREGLFKALRPHNLEDRAEDFFFVRRHIRRHMVKQRRAHKKALLMALQCKATAINNQFSALIHALLDPAFDLFLMRLRDHRAIMRLSIRRDANLQGVDCRDQLGLKPLGRLIAHGHYNGQRHAAFAC